MRRSRTPRTSCSPTPTRALARQTLLQVASLPDRVDAPAPRLDPTAPRWAFEIPFATPQGTAMAQFEISRDGGGQARPKPRKRIWRARFSLDVEPAGPVHALVSLIGDKTSVRMWAERPATAAQLRAGASAAQPGAQPRRAAARRHRDPRRRAAASRRRRRPAISWIARYDRGRSGTSSRSRCTTTRPARRASSPRARARSAPRSSKSRKRTTSRSRRTRCWPARCPMSRSATKFRQELYKAVAEVLVFVLRLSGRAR